MEQMQQLAITLQVQLNQAQCDAFELRAERERLIREREEEKEALQDALDAAIMERAENDAKWQRDFEQLRTVNSGKDAISLISLPSLCMCAIVFQIAKNFCYRIVNGKYEQRRRRARIESLNLNSPRMRHWNGRHVSRPKRNRNING